MTRLVRKVNKRMNEEAIADFMLSVIKAVHWFYETMSHIVESNSLRRSYIVKDREARAYLQTLVYSDDITCMNYTRMNRAMFAKFCNMLETVGKLKSTCHMAVDEQVAITLQILAHHTKNRVIKFSHFRSMETISRHFNNVIGCIVRLQSTLLKSHVPVSENCTDGRWKWFKGCLGALDGTYIHVNVPRVDQPRYRSRKGVKAVNVLGACTQDMLFTYVLSGWEGSAADGRILRDAIARRNGLVVPRGTYYLADAGYTNGEGFLAPFRGQRYHRNVWSAQNQPNSSEEYFNMKHSAARNVIERSFGLLKR